MRHDSYMSHLRSRRLEDVITKKIMSPHFTSMT